MKKRNCRKTDIEREQHDRAIRVRKLKAMARRDGFLPPLPELDDDML